MTVAAPYVLEPGQSRWEISLSGMRLALLARAEDTDGRLSVWEYTAPPGFPGPPLHVHRDLDEAAYVIEGTLKVRLGEEDHDVGAGQFVWMGRNVPHAFANAGETATRFIAFASPPGHLEEFFAAVADELADAEGPPDPETLMELNRRYGIEVLGPPLLAPQGS